MKSGVNKLRPTEGELEILGVLWEMNEATVKDIHQQLSTYKQTGYTTTLKLLQLMFQKGMVKRREEGRKHIYRSSIDRVALGEQQLNRLIGHLFNGSPALLALAALGSSYYRSSPEDLKALRTFLEQHQ